MKICNSFLLYLLFTENWNKKPFYFLDLLNIYEILDFTTTSCSEVYIWWRHQKMLMLVKSNYIFKKKHTWWCILLQRFVTLAFLNQRLR